jgi:hypothetical protein
MEFTCQSESFASPSQSSDSFRVILGAYQCRPKYPQLAGHSASVCIPVLRTLSRVSRSPPKRLLSRWQSAWTLQARGVLSLSRPIFRQISGLRKGSRAGRTAMPVDGSGVGFRNAHPAGPRGYDGPAAAGPTPTARQVPVAVDQPGRPGRAGGVARLPRLATYVFSFALTRCGSSFVFGLLGPARQAGSHRHAEHAPGSALLPSRRRGRAFPRAAAPWTGQ